MFAELGREADVFAKSSGYRYGDKDSFQVPVASGVTLPGNHDPHHYLNQLGLQTIPKRCLVICPGTAGLVPVLMRRGADDVVALEPRHFFAGMTQRVLALVAKGLRADQIKGKSYRYLGSWPLDADEREALGKFDLILWPEGTEDVREPRAVMIAIADLLAPTGKLVVEVWHGSHQYVPKINSWKPTGDAWFQAVKAHFGQGPTGCQEGRRQNLRIYTIGFSPAKALEDVLKQDAKKAKETPPKVEKTPPPPSPSSKPESEEPEKEPKVPVATSGPSGETMGITTDPAEDVKKEDADLVKKITEAPARTSHMVSLTSSQPRLAKTEVTTKWSSDGIRTTPKTEVQSTPVSPSSETPETEPSKPTMSKKKKKSSKKKTRKKTS